MKIYRLLSTVLILLLSFANFTFAQTTGKIAGRVVDKTTGEPLPFANVYIASINAGSASDIDGYYTILNVRPGVYEVTASIVGYKKVTVTDVRVNVDFTTRVNFELEMGNVELDVITVQGERNPLIRQDLTNPTVAITSETINELPVDNISDVIKLQAGVVTGNDGAIHIRGGYSNEVSYTLNGVSLNDPYANTRSVGLATNAVKEVSVSSGTFSAQYGNALSGVVNYVTKEGGDNYSFSIRSYIGDYLSTNDELFDNINDIDPLNRARLELTAGGPVPFTDKKLKFFISGVAEDYKGYLYGWRLYNPSDSYLDRVNFTGTGDPRKGSSSDPYYFNPYDPNSNGLPTGDSSIVPMNTSTSYNVQGNISWQISSLFKVKYEALFDKAESQSYSRAYKYNPDGRGTNYSNAIVQTLDITHTVSNNLFYTLKASYGFSKYQFYKFKDINDPGYLPALYSRYITGSDFYAGGTSNYRQYRTTATYSLKGDLVTQLFQSHEVKFGFELRLHRLKNYAYTLQVGKLNPDGSVSLTDADLLYDSTLTLVHQIPTSPNQITNYIKYPAEGAIYLSDKIELAKTLVLIVGLRYEYFDSKEYYNPEITKELEDFKFGYITRNLEKADIKHHLSPRISVSYPITDQGVIRFSYGHFYQNGNLSSLYTNDKFFVTNVGETPTFGNPNVKMQRSIQYELGLQQQLTEDLKFDLTGFYKDVRDYIYFQTVYTGSGRSYSVLTNLAYSNVRGITLSFLKRRSPGSLFYATLDYTFQVAEGNRTYPSEEIFYSVASGKQSETFLVPLSFDRSHVINVALGLTEPDNWNLGVIGNVQTGTPYTPQFPSTIVPITFEQNSANQSVQWNVDLKFEKYFNLDPFKVSLFLQVDNLFDTQRELAVWASTGKSLSAVEEVTNKNNFNDLRRRIERGDGGLFSIDEVNGYYSHRPERVSAPREVRLGFSILFN